VEDQREQRMASNEVVARHFNDTIEHAGPPVGAPQSTFICECVREDCAERIDITIQAYGAVRLYPRRFLVVRGHEEPEIETTVEAHGNFLVVEKRGEAGRIAEARAY
jgi:hypothetical protein